RPARRTLEPANQHRGFRMRHEFLAIAILGSTFTTSLSAQAAAAPSIAVSSQLDRVRAALEKYRDPIQAVHDGYLSTVGCVEFPVAGGAGQVPYVAGGMGVHFLNIGLIGPTVDSLHPQVL